MVVLEFPRAPSHKYTKKINMQEKVPDFEKIAKEAINTIAPEVALYAKNFFLQSFIKEGFTHISFIPWSSRQLNNESSNKILNQSSALKNSIKIESASPELIKIVAGQGIPYAAIHNNGGTINVKVTPKMRKYFWAMWYKTNKVFWKNMAMTKKNVLVIKIPKRQFIGESETLLKDIDKIMIRKIQELQKNL